MMIRYYSEHPLTGTALAVIREAKENVFGDQPIDFAEVQTPGPGVLCFGKGHPGAVETLTIPQVTTAPFAVSALTEAFMLIKNPRVSLPPEPDINPDPWWDFDTVLAYDIENAPDGSLLTVAVTDGERIGVWTESFEEVAAALAPCYYLIGHGMKYDTKVIERNTGTTLAQFFDTMIARYTLHPASQGHLDLKSVAQRVLGAPEWEVDLKKYTGTGGSADYSKVPLDRLIEYNAADAWYTFLLYLHLKPLVEHNPAFWFTMRTTWTISHIERVGIAIDLEHVKRLSAELETEAAAHRAKLPMDNPGSWMQVLKALGEAGVPVEFKPKGMSTPQWKSRKKMLARKGIVTGTDEKALSKLTHIEFVPELLAWRKATKLRSTYCESYLAKHEDGILFPTYNAHGTSTGRLSSSLPNFQNVPRDPRLRSIFVSRNREDGLFVSADYKNAELRTMAMLSGDEAMQALFQPGMPDYFDTTIPVAFPEFTYEDYLALKKSDPDEAKEMRTLLKTCVPLDTKILTQRGWLSHDEVREGDLTPALDGIGRTVWSRINKVYHFEDAELVRLGNARWSFVTTPDHRWAVSSMNKYYRDEGELFMEETRNLAHNRVLHVAGKLDDEGVPGIALTDDEISVVAWVATDGYAQWSELTGRTSQGINSWKRGLVAGIVQSKPHYVAEIRALLDRLNAPYTEDTRPGVKLETSHTFRLAAAWARELLRRAGVEEGDYENLVLRMNQRQREVFLETCWKAEGHTDAGGTRLLTQNAGRLHDAMLLCATLLGYRATTTVHTAGGRARRIRLNRNRYVTAQKFVRETIGRGDVWCVETERGTWTARQGDTIAITGNCIFGLSYNRQAPAIAEALGVSVEYAQSVIDNYLNGFPKLKAWRARVEEAALDPDKRDFLVTPFGKRFESEVVTDNNRQSVINAALAFLPQSTASDICVDAASRILPQLPDGVFLVGLVHDMHGYDVTDPDKLPELVELLEREMPAAGARVFGDAVPFMVDIEVGRSWGEHD